MKLTQEVTMLVDGLIKNKRIVHPSLLTQEIIDAHSEIYGADADWYRHCATERVRDLVREAIRRLKLTARESPDPQLTFPGWRYLQKAYSVKRDGIDQGIPIGQLTPDEISVKRAELERMGESCFNHAEELGRYLQEKLQ